MPEGDTVWNTAKVLDRGLAGQVITHSDFRVPQLATVDLTGWTVVGCAPRGKHLLLRLTPPAPADRTGSDPTPSDAPATLHSHLRMDGAWRVFAPGAPWRGRPAHVIRVVLTTATAVAVGFHLHEVALVPTAEEPELVGHLGPDLLGEPGQPGGWDRAEALRRLGSHPDVSIAEALLDQRNLAGIGNLYKAEVLYLRGINPWRPVSAVAGLGSVVDLSRQLLLANRGRWTQATTGSLRRGQEVYVYGRLNQPCRRCGTLIKRETQGERITFWCPTCQPA